MIQVQIDEESGAVVVRDLGVARGDTPYTGGIVTTEVTLHRQHSRALDDTVTYLLDLLKEAARSVQEMDEAGLRKEREDEEDLGMGF